MKEIWKTIKEYPKYEISSYGRVKCKAYIYKTKRGQRYKKEKYVNTSINNAGYEVCCLIKDDKTYIKTIHRLVAETFIDNPNNLSDVDHIDNDKLNNRVDNLQWLSHKDNINKIKLTDPIKWEQMHNEENYRKQKETWGLKRVDKMKKLHSQLLLMYVYDGKYYKTLKEFANKNKMTYNEAKYFMRLHNIKKEVVLLLSKQCNIEYYIYIRNISTKHYESR